MKILSGKQAKPRRALLYGQHGVGKGTWASQAPNPIFLNLEDGLADIECDKTEHIKDAGTLNSYVSWLIQEDHKYHTVVLDTADWCELLYKKKIAGEFSKNTYEEIEYGRGAGRLEKEWQWLLSSFEHLNKVRRMHIILLAHSRIEKFVDPLGANYDRYVPDLNKASFGLVQEWCDEVFFARFRVLTNENKEAFGAKSVKAVGGKDRYILTNEAGSSMAKNRLNLPDELSMNWQEYYSYWPKPAAVEPVPAPVGNIAGVVVNGSSKVPVSV